MEAQFVNVYGGQGLVVAAIDPGGSGGTGGNASTDGTAGDMALLQDYVSNLHVSYPVGLENPDTKTYVAMARNYVGANPFPVDIILDKHGIIRYVAREYDSASMIQMIEQLLQEQ